MNQNSFIRTDLATELHESLREEESLASHLCHSEENADGVKISRIHIKSQEGEGLLGKPMGKYITLSFGKVWLMSRDQCQSIAEHLAKAIKELMAHIEPPVKRVLVAGLGNRNLTADTIGPLTAEKITLTRPIALSDPKLFEKLCHLETSVIIPCVSGETGIESTDLVKSAVDIVKPNLIIAVDALGARSPDRLLSTIQLCDTGIAPGSGVGNAKSHINSSSMGVPVIAIGIPTVVDSSTLVYDALEKSGIDANELPGELAELLNNQRSFFVSPKECDIAIKELTSIVAQGLDLALSTSF